MKEVKSLELGSKSWYQYSYISCNVREEDKIYEFETKRR